MLKISNTANLMTAKGLFKLQVLGFIATRPRQNDYFYGPVVKNI